MKPIKIGRGILDQISKPIEYKKLTTEDVKDVKDVMTTYLESLHTINRNSHFIAYCGVKMLTVMDLMIKKELLLKSHNKNSKKVRKIDLEIRRISNDAYAHKGWDYLSKPYYDLNIKATSLEYNIFNEVDEEEFLYD